MKTAAAPRVLLLVLLALLAGAFLIGMAVPYRINADTAFQLKSLQQWVDGRSPSPGTLRLPDPRDLSRDVLLWSNWWPPGFPFSYAPLAATGLRLADALRATSLLLFLIGSVGWLRLARDPALSPGVRLLYVLSLAVYALSLGGAVSLRSADVLAYAAGPWLAQLVLSRAEGPQGAMRLFACGLALGATYWLRYSLFLLGLALLACLALHLLRGDGRLWPISVSRLGRLAALGLGFALPVALLLAVNLAQSKDLTETVTGTRSAWVIEDHESARPALLALSLAGAPGMGLFQNDLWITHTAYFSDRHLPFLRDAGSADRLLVKALLGLPVTLALFWGLAREHRRRPRPVVALALGALAGFYLALAAVSLLVGYNYLGHEARFAIGLMPLVHPLVLSGWLAPGRRLSRLAAALLLALFFAVPLAFAAVSFLKNDVHDRFLLRYTTSRTGLYTPEISSQDVPAVQAAVNAALRSPRDVVVVAGPDGWGCAYAAWLELPQRTLPLGALCPELGARYAEASNVRGDFALRSTADLRVVLVLEKTLVEGSLSRLQARFPQALGWQTVPTPPHSNVAVYCSDLRADG